MVSYRSVDTSTLKGLRRAEWYHTHGWTLYSTGLFILKFYKKYTRKGRK